MIYGETGRFPLEVIVKTRMIKYWSRIVLGKKDKLSFISYNICKNHFFNLGLETDWISCINKILTSINYVNWNYIETDIAEHEVNMIGRNIKAKYVESWTESIQNAPACQSLYKHIKSSFESEFYLSKLPESLRLSIAKFRTLNHRLPIQRGRYDGTLRGERLCRLCDEDVVGDEFHFILNCRHSRLVELRSQYLAPYYRFSPSLEKLKELFCNRDRKLFRLAISLKEAIKLI